MNCEICKHVTAFLERFPKGCSLADYSVLLKGVTVPPNVPVVVESPPGPLPRIDYAFTRPCCVRANEKLELLRVISKIVNAKNDEILSILSKDVLDLLSKQKDQMSLMEQGLIQFLIENRNKEPQPQKFVDEKDCPPNFIRFVDADKEDNRGLDNLNFLFREVLDDGRKNNGFTYEDTKKWLNNSLSILAGNKNKDEFPWVGVAYPGCYVLAKTQKEAFEKALLMTTGNVVVEKL